MILMFSLADFKVGKGSLDNGYLNNLDNGFSNKYDENLKNRKKNLWICSYAYRLMVIQILCNFIIA
jgi:hypothetical protein